MQFRAEAEHTDGRLLFRLAGRLDREQSAELVRLCDEARKPVRLDLTDLMSVDAVGVATLGTLQSRGAELVGASPYLALQLEAAQTGRTEERDGAGARARPGRAHHARRTEDKREETSSSSR